MVIANTLDRNQLRSLDSRRLGRAQQFGWFVEYSTRASFCALSVRRTRVKISSKGYASRQRTKREVSMQPSMSTLEQLAQHYTTAPLALGELARAYAMRGRLGEAQRVLQAALQLVPDQPAQGRLQL